MSFSGNTLPRARALFTVTLIMALATLGVIAGPASPATAAESDTIHSLVNQARADSGLPPLARNGQMDAVANNWANEMAAVNTMSHNPSYSEQISAGWTSAAENVAYGQSTGAEMHVAWMNSPGHRKNILGDFTDVGIAFVHAGGTTWGVQVFARYPGNATAPSPAPSRTQTPAPAPAPVAKPTPQSAPAPAPAPAAKSPAAKSPAAKNPPAKKPAEAAPSEEEAADVADATAEESNESIGTESDVRASRSGARTLPNRDLERDAPDESAATQGELAETVVALAASKQAPAGGLLIAVLLIGAVILTRLMEVKRRPAPEPIRRRTGF